MDRRHALGLAGLLLAITSSSIAHAEVVTLAELEKRAVQNRPALAREGARSRIAEADMRKATSAYYPQFALKADTSVGPGRQLLEVNAGDTTILVAGAPSLNGKGQASRALKPYPRSGVELTASANIYDFGRTKAAIAAGRESQAAALANRSLTEAELRSAIHESYLAWLLSSELTRLSSGALAEASSRRERVAALVDEGVRPKGELTPARADELLAKLELERAQRDLDSSRLTLEQAVGAPLSGAAEPDVSLLSTNSQLPDASQSDDSSRRALLQRFKAAKVAAAAQATLNRPQLGIGASAGVRVSTQNTTTLGDSSTPDTVTSVFPLYAAGLTLTVPLWDGGFTRAGVDAANARADEAKAELAQYELDRDFGQRHAQLDASSALTRLQTTEELVSVCSARLKDAEAGYELGVSSIDLIGQARGLLRRAQTEALLARVDHAAARLRMVRKDAPASGQ